MHETGIALAIYEQAREQIPDAKGRLESVEVVIGELSAVEPDLLSFAWQAVVADGPDRDARLEIDWCPARHYCPRCDRLSKRTGIGWFKLCEVCQGTLLCQGGQELDLKRIIYS